MKKLVIKIDLEYEVPDDWEICTPDDDSQFHIKIGEKYFHPEITWMSLDDPAAENMAWTEADDEFIEDMWDRLLGFDYSLDFIE